jgi:hypothetical protein
LLSELFWHLFLCFLSHSKGLSLLSLLLFESSFQQANLFLFPVSAGLRTGWSVSLLLLIELLWHLFLHFLSDSHEDISTVTVMLRVIFSMSRYHPFSSQCRCLNRANSITAAVHRSLTPLSALPVCFKEAVCTVILKLRVSCSAIDLLRTSWYCLLVCVCVCVCVCVEGGYVMLD